MKYVLFIFCVNLFLNFGFSQPTKKIYEADILFKQKEYDKALDIYEKELYSLNSGRLKNVIICNVKIGNNKGVVKAIENWINQGTSPYYIETLLKYYFVQFDLDSTKIVDVFRRHQKKWNNLYSTIIMSNYNEYMKSQLYFNHDQHLRFVEIDTRKKVDSETFLTADSLNMERIKEYMRSNNLTYPQFANDMLFGVVHHYCGERFFTSVDFEFFKDKLFELAKNNVIDISVFCYFVDKYMVFHGQKQIYGTYEEFEGIAGVTQDDYNDMNVRRIEVGYHLTVENQIKYGK